jgi:hypothetical protein
MIEGGKELPTQWMGDQQPSAFVDDVNTGSGTYLYTIENFGTGLSEQDTYPGTQSGTIGVARALLGQGGELAFTKWYGPDVSYNNTSSGSFAPQEILVRCFWVGWCPISNAGLGDDGGGLESPIFPLATVEETKQNLALYDTCQAHDQSQGSASISFIDDYQLYLLTFVCKTPKQPLNPKATSGIALFFATSSNLADQTAWSAPQEIPTSYQPLNDRHDCVYDGWYSTFISTGQHNVGHISTSGYVFSLNGCEGPETTPPRQYSSRTFTIAAN